MEVGEAKRRERMLIVAVSSATVHSVCVCICICIVSRIPCLSSVPNLCFRSISLPSCSAWCSISTLFFPSVPRTSYSVSFFYLESILSFCPTYLVFCLVFYLHIPSPLRPCVLNSYSTSKSPSSSRASLTPSIYPCPNYPQIKPYGHSQGVSL